MTGLQVYEGIREKGAGAGYLDRRANIDLTVRVPRLPSPGASQTIFGSELVATAGGKSLNQALAVARLGGRVGLVANVGADHWGHQLRNVLTESGVDVRHVCLVPDAPTGAAIIEVTPDGEGVIVLAVSPRTELTLEQVEAALAVSTACMVVVQLDLPPASVTAVMTDVRPGTLRVGNLVPNPALDPDLLRCLDLLVVNQHEASTILDTDGQIDPLVAAHRLRLLGPTTAVVTAGADGAAYSSPDHAGRQGAPTVSVVDTTGAGDAFLGALVTDLADGSPLPDAVARAVLVGAGAVQHDGAHRPNGDGPW